MIERAMTLIDPSFRPKATPTRATVGWVQVEANPEGIAAARSALAVADITVRSLSLQLLAAAFAAGLAIIGAGDWAAFGHLIEGGRLGRDGPTRRRGGG